MKLLRTVKSINIIRKKKNLILFFFIVAGFLYIIYNFIIKKESGVEIPDNLPVNKLKLTFDEGTLKSKTAAIWNAMRNVGTDEKIIFDIFKSLNKDEINFVFNDFGFQKKDLIFGTESKKLGKDLNLQGWLKSELSNRGNYSYDNLKAILKEKQVYLL